MKYSLCLLVLFVAAALADPVYWETAIPNGLLGNPVPRQYQTLTNVPGTPYNVLFGGQMYNSTYIDLNDTWILDSSVPIWKAAVVSSAPPARSYAVAGATTTEVILFGGHSFNPKIVPQYTYFSDVWKFSLSNLSWTQDSFTVPSPVLARTIHAGALVGDSLYIFGGFVPALQAVANDVWSYNITSKSWTLHSANGRAGAPPPRQGHSAVFYNDSSLGPSIIFFGGYNGSGGGYSDTWQFVTASSTWIQLSKDKDPNGPSPRFASSAIFTANPPTVTIFGGMLNGVTVSPYYNDLWSLSWTGSAWNWTELIENGDLEGPWKRGGHSSVISAGGAYTFGGYGMYVGLYNDLWQLFNA